MRKLRKLQLSYCLTVLLYCLIYILITNLFQFQPFSDFEDYWNSASQITSYSKGGGLIVIYSLFKHFGLTPFYTALIVNTLSFLGLAWVFYPRKFSTRSVLSVFAIFVFGIWYLSMIQIVNSDLPSIALTIVSLYLIMSVKQGNNWTYIFALLLFSIAVSMRMQLALGFGLFLIFRGVFATSNKKLIITLLIFLIFGIFIHGTMAKLNPDLSVNIISSRVPLYSGILVAEKGQYCGMWNLKAKYHAVNEIDLPLYQIVYKYFNIDTFKDIIICKFNLMVSFDTVTAYWLNANYYYFNNHGNDLLKESVILIIQHVENIVILIFKFILFFMIISSFKKSYLRGDVVIIVISFILVHLLFEIQHRYLLAPYILAAFFFIEPYKSAANDLHSNNGDKIK